MDPRYIFSPSYNEELGEDSSSTKSRHRKILKKEVEDKSPELPSKREMAANLGKSLLRTAKAALAGDSISAADEVREKRSQLCLSCPWYMKESKRCAKCGCVVPMKIYLAEESCPIGKW
tara:strand:+ start:833 stop:1189 length:357 start_codon:yes stop_codon:yes gene_type:complete